jgi:diguanylate cyclase (GGDEF)-like protein
MSASGRAWMVAVIAGAVLLTARELAASRMNAHQVLLGAVLVACACACQEAARRQGLPDGATRDLLTAWCLPVALLLPTCCALCVPVVAAGLRYARTRGPVAATAFRAATLGLAGASASYLFRSLGAAGKAHWFAHPSLLVEAMACAAVFAMVNATLAAVAAYAADPVAGWRVAAWNHENLLFDVAGLCAGVLVAVASSDTPVLLLVALPPVMLLQRSLPHQQLRVAARTDAKTGLLNAAAWQREADARVRAARRAGAPVALLLADIDHFKWVNDLHGHLAGDEVLRAVATALRAELRDGELLGRFGGEEFVVLASATELAGAAEIAQQVRDRVAGLAVWAAGGWVRVTVSIGVAALPAHGSEFFELLAAADVALYRAKRAGRDCVCVLPPVRSHA